MTRRFLHAGTISYSIPPVFTGCNRSSNGFVLQFSGELEPIMNIGFANLNDWQFIGVATQVSAGHYSFLDNGAINLSRRYYRSRTRMLTFSLNGCINHSSHALNEIGILLSKQSVMRRDSGDRKTRRDSKRSVEELLATIQTRLTALPFLTPNQLFEVQAHTHVHYT